MNRTKHALLLPIALLVASCGGSAGGGAPAGPTLSLGISWAARSRDAHAPSSALSAVVHPQGSGGFAVNRRDQPDAYTATYQDPNVLAAGNYNVSVVFYSQPDGAGDAVGIASGSVTIGPTGGSLGEVTTQGTIANVDVQPSQTLPVGGAVSLLARCTDAQGRLIAIAPGGAFWSLVSGADKLAVRQDGFAQGLAVGSADVAATVDGITSAPGPVTVANLVNVGCSNTAYAPNYADAIQNSSNPNVKGSLEHWAAFPLHVALVGNSYLNSQNRTTAIEALESWVRATGGRVTYRLVSDASTADIKITFVPAAQIQGGDSQTVGLTSNFTAADDPSLIVKSNMQIASDLGNRSETLNDVAHEFGHALGIFGHSPNGQDLMFYALNEQFQATSNDLNTLITAYCDNFPNDPGRTHHVASPIPHTIVDHR